MSPKRFGRLFLKICLFDFLLLYMKAEGHEYSKALYITKVYLEPCQRYKTERFARIVISPKPLTIFAKRPSQMFDMVLNKLIH